MNIHPVFVHFPIALLTFYALLEILRFNIIKRIPGILSIKFFLLLIGSIGAFLALQTGELAEESFNSESVRSLIETHSTIASITTYVFVILLIGYIVYMINQYRQRKLLSMTVSRLDVLNILWKVLVNISDFIMRPSVLVILTILGLVAVTVTGALGGAIVYGPNIDPFVSFVYKLFF
ncbi:MAG: hypothetical protein WCW14_00390 [Candidatus Paceibacterota bacterium]|jgi:uncharacterized membrane protein